MLHLPDIFARKKPDIKVLTEKKDIYGLIRALNSSDLDVHTAAAKALGAMGNEAVDDLAKAIRTRKLAVKLGIIGALSEIRDPRSIPCLTDALADKNSEVRWQAAVALGEIDDVAVIEPLVKALRDTDKYVRYGSAFALAKRGWKPKDEKELSDYYIGMQEWKAAKDIGKSAIPSLTRTLRDRDNIIRTEAIDVLGEIQDPQATPALMRSLGDENREVRWHAMLASPKCGIPLRYLPRGLAKRPQVIKNPLIAAFLNFLLPGLGYGYLGKWWGVLIFQVDITATVWLFKYESEGVSYQTLFPIYLALAIHAWYLATKMPKDPP
ncbi:MAG TPA: HEAT repeat domain-containing protein [Methanoregula sp.]|nr:HEAT repeat domain-containing protein [Methanoregula sp.]